ncbi:MAG: copper-binding protein [Nitrosarchaeum sp.]|nr:copper-binding protein [Nitrosarchaeum sp.]
MKILIAVLLIPLLIIPAFAQTNSQTLQTDKGTLDVKLSYDDISTGDQTRLLIEFINPVTKKIQEHIDYRLAVSKDGEPVFGPIPLTHTSEGVVKGLKVEFPEEGIYLVEFEIEGILFQPIPAEKVSFDVTVGEAYALPPPVNDKNGGGCLIATAAFGSELSPQVQQLREFRDNTVLATQSGTAFMTTFNQFYYSFSPIIADYEREQPIFKEAVKIVLTPMLTSLSILNHANIDSEQEMIGYGVGIILLNIGMYIGIPVFGILKIYQFNKR